MPRPQSMDPRRPRRDREKQRETSAGEGSARTPTQPAVDQRARARARGEPSTATSTSTPTIRAVTPDALDGPPPPAMPDDELSSDNLSPPNSPRSNNSSASASAHLARAANPRGFVARAASESDYRHAREQTRPRTRTLEERSTRETDRSPSTLFAGRHRVGSVASPSTSPGTSPTAAAPGYQSLEESVVTSIGHISTISPLPLQPPPRASSANSRSRLVKLPLRTASPALSPSHAQPDSWVSPVPAADVNKLKALMRATCGKMQGLLAFRRGDSSPWSLSYCYINDDAGSLVYEPKNDSSYTRTLIPDLRGCHVKSAYDGEAYTAYIYVLVHNSKLEVHLRPPTQDEFDSWFAALLCWAPMRPKGIQNRMAKPQIPMMMERRLTDARRHSEVSLLKEAPKKEAPIIKVGKMIYWDTSITYSNTSSTQKGTDASRPQAFRIQSHGSRRWRRVSCTLRENGELKLYSDTDVTLVSTVQLSQLSRCAVQRLDPSVLDNEFCIAIYPQYTASLAAMSILRPIFLSLESRVLYEVWIVLLRAFTVPQLYGPKTDTLNEEGALSPSFGTQDMFRMEKSLVVKVVEARMTPPVSPKVAETHVAARPSSATTSPGGFLVEVLLDGETRARTLVKGEGNNPFWNEEFEFLDLPALHTASVVLKRRPPGHSRHDKGSFDSTQSPDPYAGEGGVTGVNFDQTIGKTDIYLDELGQNHEMEKWWPLSNMYGNNVGEVLVRVSSEECAILMARDYYPLSELLHRFSNSLTLQIAVMIPNELKRLSEYLLNIFQVSGAAGEWLCALVEEEIDGTSKDTPASRLRFSKRLGSSESNDTTPIGGQFGSTSDRELFVRDMGNNAKLEANLLFRGNTLLTKSLDLHMKRLGKEYLEETLSEKLKEINEQDPECEVDPNRVSSQNELDRNWRRLINCTEEVWRAIYNSVARCPQELRLIFRHIRACAEDRYGDYLRTVKYSSVSGFLFLRFFVPAVLNPKLFGLLPDNPKMKSRRTFTLIAKSLQGLANMTSFGTKEAWMEPMNAFLTSHRQEFKKYLDDICSISSTSSPTPNIPPSYSTPIAILHRLPPTFKEGFPSLPYLIDHSRNFASLVNLWLDNTKKSAQDIQAGDGDLLRFHKICVSLSERTKECLNRAEPAERPSSSLSVKWEELVEQLHGAAFLESGRGAATRNNRGPIIEEQSPTSPNGEDYSSSSTSTPVTLSAPTKYRHQQNSSVSGTTATAVNSMKSNSSSTITYTNPFASKAWSGRYASDPKDSISASQSASPSASVAASTTDETPPGSSDGLHMAGTPSYPPLLGQPPAPKASSKPTFNYSNPNVHINMSNSTFASPNSFRGRRGSVGGQSNTGSENESMEEEEYTTALPAFSSKEGGKEKDRKDHGFRGILPFQRQRKRKDKGKDRDRSADRNDKDNRGSALGESTGSAGAVVAGLPFRGKGIVGRRESAWEDGKRRDDKKDREKKDDHRDKDEEF